MKPFQIKPVIQCYASFAEFTELVNFAPEDCIFTLRYLDEKWLKPLNMPSSVLLFEDYGSGEPTDEMIDRILTDFGKLNCRRVIAIGGGSVLDIAKILALKSSMSPAVDLFAGKVWYSADQDVIEAFRNTVFHDGKLNPAVIGRPASEVAAAAGISIPETTRLILLKAQGAGRADILCKEKLCPVVAILPYASFEQALEMAQANLEVEGKGHTAAIHSNNEEHIRTTGLRLTVSRIVVNQASATSAGGSFLNGFSPTTTLGCGSWGGNSISENLNYTHLMNVSRIGKVIASQSVPTTPDEIWE